MSVFPRLHDLKMILTVTWRPSSLLFLRFNGPLKFNRKRDLSLFISEGFNLFKPHFSRLHSSRLYSRSGPHSLPFGAHQQTAYTEAAYTRTRSGGIFISFNNFGPEIRNPGSQRLRRRFSPDEITQFQRQKWVYWGGRGVRHPNTTRGESQVPIPPLPQTPKADFEFGGHLE